MNANARYMVISVLSIFNEGATWNKCQFSIRPSLYFSSIVKSLSNLFLEPSRTKQRGYLFLFNETTGAFDGEQTHN